MIHETIAHLAVPVGELSPYKGNPRKGNIPAIADSLMVNGQYRPIVARTRTGQILAGTHTYLAARKLGWPTVAATFVDVDDATAARIVAVDSRSNDLASYDNDALVTLLRDLPSLEGTGWDQAALDKLLGELPDPGDADTDDDVPEVWGVVVECGTEAEQAELLNRLTSEGLRVRALVA